MAPLPILLYLLPFLKQWALCEVPDAIRIRIPNFPNRNRIPSTDTDVRIVAFIIVLFYISALVRKTENPIQPFSRGIEPITLSTTITKTTKYSRAIHHKNVKTRVTPNPLVPYPLDFHFMRVRKRDLYFRLCWMI